VVSGLGDGVFWVALIGVLLDRGVGARGFALAALVRLGPRALLSAPAGVLVDRVDRRVLLVGLDLARAVLVVGVALSASAGVGLALLFGGVLGCYTLAAPYRPALTAALPVVAGERDLASANAIVGTVRQLMTFIGPVVGAIVVHWSSPTAGFLVNAGSFALAALLIGRVRELEGPRVATGRRLASHRAEWMRDAAGGWREMVRTRGLTVIAVVVFAMYAARGAELVLYALVAGERLGLGSTGIGVLTGAVGLGAVVALPAVQRLAAADRPDLVLLASVATSALPIALLGFTRSPVAACAALVVVGAGVVVFEVVSVLLLQRLARRSALGRVFGLVGTVSNAGKLIGAVVAPVLVDAIDLPRTLMAVGGVIGLVGVAAAPGLISLATSTRQDRLRLRPIVEVLGSLRLFDGASGLVLERLAGSLVTERVEAGRVVMAEGDPADDLFVVLEGDLDVTAEGRQVNDLHANDWFGEIGLLNRWRRTATVTTATPTVLWRIPGNEFLAALQDLSGAPEALLDVMADRLANTGHIEPRPTVTVEKAARRGFRGG